MCGLLTSLNDSHHRGYCSFILHVQRWFLGLTIRMRTLEYPLRCACTNLADAHVIGYFNNQWHQINALTSSRHCQSMVQFFVASEYTYTQNSGFIYFAYDYSPWKDECWSDRMLPDKLCVKWLPSSLAPVTCTNTLSRQLSRFSYFAARLLQQDVKITCKSCAWEGPTLPSVHNAPQTWPAMYSLTRHFRPPSTPHQCSANNMHCTCTCIQIYLWYIECGCPSSLYNILSLVLIQWMIKIWFNLNTKQSHSVYIETELGIAHPILIFPITDKYQFPMSDSLLCWIRRCVPLTAGLLAGNMRRYNPHDHSISLLQYTLFSYAMHTHTYRWLLPWGLMTCIISQYWWRFFCATHGQHM